MSAGSEILREFLIAISYKNDEVGQKKLVEGVDKITKGLTSLVVGAEAAALGVVAALGKMAAGFEQLAYSSGRTGAAVKELQAFKYAAAQTGSTAEEATAAVEGLAQKMRENRGFKSLVQGLTHDSSNDVVRQIRELGPAFAKMSSEQAHATAGMLGIPEHLLLALQDPKFARFYSESEAKTNALGVDMDQAAKDGQQLTRRFRDLQDTIGKIVDAAGSPLFQQLNEPLKNLNQFLVDHGQEIANIIGRVAAAFLRIATETLKLIPAADKLADSMGGWTTVFEGLAAVVSAAFVARVAGLLGSFKALSILAIPPWLKAVLGVSAATDIGVPNKDKPGMIRRWDDSAGGLPGDLADSDMDEADRRAGNKGREGFMKRARDRLFGRGSGKQGGRVAKGGWWTPDRQKEAYDRLTAGGMPSASAIALISRWKNVESTGAGPDASNAIGGGHWGIAQMDRARWARVGGTKGFSDQLDAVLDEYKTGRADGAYMRASTALRDAQTDAEAATAASSYERSEGYTTYRNGRDNYTDTTERGMAEVRRNVIPQRTPPMLRPHSGGPVPMPKNMVPLVPGDPGFNSSLAAPPLGSQANDNSRSVTVIDQSKTTVNGVSDPAKAADHIGRIGDRQSSLLLRNLQSAVG